MSNFRRFAVYYAPERGAFSRFAAEWLGWCPTSGTAKPHPEVHGLPTPVAEITETPRKYGFHGTLKPPFRLADGADQSGLERALAALAARLAPVRMEGLALSQIGSFVALMPEGDVSGLSALAAACVTDLDSFRAPAPEAELARRRAAGLSERQERYLKDWGYPYVLEEFKFHLTLSGRLSEADAQQLHAALDPVLCPLLPRPFVIRDLSLFGEDEDGRFHIIDRFALSG